MSGVEKIKTILGDVLGMPATAIPDDASVETLEAWDSIAHLNFVMSVEQVFGVSLTPEEAVAMTELAACRRILEGKGVQA